MANSKINRNIVPENFNLGLAIFDSVPVIFFSLAAILLGLAMDSLVFIFGGIISAISGLIKVIWKLIVVLKKKNIWWMFLQMRIAMPIGFVLMIIGAIVVSKTSNFADIIYFSKTFPVSFCFVIGAVGIVLMIIAAKELNSANVRDNWIEQTINSVAQFSIFLGVCFLSISVGYYKADTTALNALKTDPFVLVQENDNQYTFSPISGTSTKGLIFYPGGKVEYKAYAPLMKQIASKGITCYLVEMPLNYAWLGTNKADSIINSNKNITSWYIAGHSLGGAIAGTYAEKNKNKLDGVILLGAYTTSSLTDLSVLSIYGSEDKVLSKEKYDKYKSNLTDSCVEVVIPGGNHSYFGSYGEQEGDGKATITPIEQWTATTNSITTFIK